MGGIQSKVWSILNRWSQKDLSGREAAITIRELINAESTTGDKTEVLLRIAKTAEGWVCKMERGKVPKIWSKVIDLFNEAHQELGGFLFIARLRRRDRS